MSSISEIKKNFYKKTGALDLELIISAVIKKPREFILAHPEYKLIKNYELKITNYLRRRINGEPLAYILGNKEFYGLKFKVDKNVLIPRPETEMMVEEAINLIKQKNKKTKKQNLIFIDVGTGSGCIIVTLAKFLSNYKLKIKNYELIGIDISKSALKIARQNAKLHKVDKKIKFIKGGLLEPILKNKKLITCLPVGKVDNCKLIIAANLPYLSPKIYASADIGVKKYEPESALLSANHGLAHYEELLRQIKKYRFMFHVSCFMEISPEQKPRLTKIIKKYLPKAKIEFKKDLAGKWRVCKFEVKK
jgi:release factor glutamine methyltransferase